ncbi:hypothetical protein [Microvirga arabica]|uniref:hypothetical protein n=1 Tax=Microvirga arabica TaxID=1128671 RepID=UPI00193A2F1A|nr:hypothetical protein [Microvirga arabica]MBM1169338.1 hypothetical protein [Microvirga arabica]
MHQFEKGLEFGDLGQDRGVAADEIMSPLLPFFTSLRKSAELFAQAPFPLEAFKCLPAHPDSGQIGNNAIGDVPGDVFKPPGFAVPPDRRAARTC